MATKFTFAYNIFCTTDYAGACVAARSVRRKHAIPEHIKVIIQKVTYLDDGTIYTDYIVSVFRHHNHTDLPF